MAPLNALQRIQQMLMAYALKPPEIQPKEEEIPSWPFVQQQHKVNRSESQWSKLKKI